MKSNKRGFGSVAAVAAIATLGWACSRQSDGYGPPQVGGVLSALDTKELQEAQIAQTKASAPAIKSYADRIVADLTTTRAGVQRVLQQQNIQPVVTRASQDIEADAYKSVSELQSKAGPDFDKAYIEQEVQDKQEVLDKLDQDLIPNARNPELKQYLQANVRPTVQSHLNMARLLKHDMSSEQLTLTDPQIAGVLAVLDNAEIEEGIAAQKKAASPDVNALAQHMVTEHALLKNDLNSLLQKQGISMATSPDSNQLANEAMASTQQLEEKTGAAFDKGYLDAQLQDHKKALQLIDTKLVPATRNPELLTFIKDRVRPRIQQHLTLTEQTLATLASKSDTDPKKKQQGPRQTPAPGAQ